MGKLQTNRERSFESGEDRFKETPKICGPNGFGDFHQTQQFCLCLPSFVGRDLVLSKTNFKLRLSHCEKRQKKILLRFVGKKLMVMK